MNPLLQALMNPDVNPLGAPGLGSGLANFLSPQGGWAGALGWNSMPPYPQTPSTPYAQGLASNYGDAQTAASTVGVKSAKAQKIKKAKSQTRGADIYIDSTPSTRNPQDDRNEINSLRQRYSELRGSSSI